MKDYIQKLCAYVQQNKITFEEECSQPCLDALWWHYSEFHNQDSEAAREGYRALRRHLEALSLRDGDTIFSDMCCLCAEYERIAFTAGMRLGVQLMLEIQRI